MNTPPHRTQFLAFLLSAWESRGHALGTDQHLQIRLLIDRLPSDTPIDHLDTLLAPVLAQDARSQEQFYRIFGETLRQFRQLVPDGTSDLIRPGYLQDTDMLSGGSSPRRPGLPQLWRIAVLSLVCCAVSIFVGRELYRQVFHVLPAERSAQSRVVVPYDGLMDAESGLRVHIFPLSEPDNRRPGIIETVQRTARSGNLLKEEVIRVGESIELAFQGFSERESCIHYQICFENGRCEPLELLFKPVDHTQIGVHLRPSGSGPFRAQVQMIKTTDSDATLLQTDNQSPDRSLPEGGKALYSLTNPYDTAFTHLAAAPNATSYTAKVRFGSALHLSPLKGVFLMLFGGGLVFLGWWIRRRQQQFQWEQQINRTAPYTWTIRVPGLRPLPLGSLYQHLLIELSQRERYATSRVDIDRTVARSARQAGAIDVTFEEAGRLQPYLLLIDLSSPQNHRTRALEWLSDQLLQDEAPVERFFFDGRPQQCWNEQYPEGLPLHRLQHKYAAYRLVLCTSGRQLRPAHLDAFKTWRRRVLLTPQSADAGGTSEQLLARSFPLLPALPAGIRQLVDTLEDLEPDNFRKSKVDHFPIPLSATEDLIEQLRRAYPNEAFLQWIAACAIPPTLFWQWTLRTGQALGTTENQLYRLEHIYELTRLPWFVEGKMPEDVRRTLVDWLEATYPDRYARFRRLWADLLELEENLPPVGSTAWDDHRIEVLLNELLQLPEKARRRQLEQELEQLLTGRKKRDAMLLKYLEQQPAVHASPFSERIRSLVQQQHSHRDYWRPWVWQAPLFLMVAVLTALLHVGEPVTIFGFDNYVSDVAFTPDGKQLLVASGQGGVSVLTPDGAWVQGIEERDAGKIVELAVSPDGQTIYSGTSEGRLDFWDIEGFPTLEQVVSKRRVISDISFHFGAPHRMLLGYAYSGVVIYDTQTRSVVKSYLPKEEIVSVAGSADGQTIVASSWDGRTFLIDRSTDQIVMLSDHDKRINSVAFTADNRYFVTGGEDRKAIVYDRLGNLRLVLDNHNSRILQVAFSPTGEEVLTTTTNKAYLWSAENGQLLRIFRGHDNYVSAVAFSPDGKSVVTGDRNGKVQLWRLSISN